ncbi:UvrD-helicase domain-containing protein [Aquipuribacter nitratireducens]|uniref:DNA 3'-5' helicase n=1 Tax=Aquipuribacter nitratireducens TaxID=650104 RepID=A0ABW0GL65_9MICO
MSELLRLRELRGVDDLEAALDLRYRLGEEQRAVVTAPLGSGLVVAGAGSGKTETMSLRVAWLVGTHQVEPEEVLGLTFTRKAAGELAERVTRAVERLQSWLGHGDAPVLVERPTARTYHSFAAALVADHAGHLGLDEPRLVGEAAAWQAAHRLVVGWPHPMEPGKNPSQVTAALLSLAGQCAEHGVEPEALARSLRGHLDALRAHAEAGWLTTQHQRDVVASLERRLALVPLLESWRETKRERGVVDHGDQVALAVSVARSEGVRQRLRAEHRVVLLDEYQDTSTAQTDLLAGLFGDGHPVTAVGDPHQSIFGWRGASAGTLSRFLDRFRRPDGTAPDVFSLSTSWRNPSVVLEVANVLAAPLREAGVPGGAPVGVLRPAPTAPPGAVRVLHVADEAEESATVAEWLRSRREHPVDDRPPTQAVLCRRRSQMGRVEDALRAAGVPVVVLGLGGLLDEPEVVDVVSLVAAAVDPTRGDALVRLLTGARWGLAAPDLEALRDRARELAGDDRDSAGLVDAVELLPGPGWRSASGRTLSEVARERLGQLAGVLARVRSVAHRPAVDVVVAAITASATDVEVEASADDARQARRVLDRLVEEAAAYADVDGASDVVRFLAWLDVARTEERGLDAVDVTPDPTAVQVLTVHSAKGLEWDDVAVVDLVAGGFPVREGAGGPGWGWLRDDGALPFPSRGDSDSLPVWSPAAAVSRSDAATRLERFRAGVGAHAALEERRLAYVAVTRPRRALLLTGARWGTGTRPRPPSPFLTEARDVAGGSPRWVDDALDRPEPPETGGGQGAAWPADAPAVRERLARAAAEVRAATPLGGPRGGEPSPGTAPTEPTWSHLVDVVLAERAARGGAARALPGHLSASQVVALAADPDGARADLLRPVPTRPQVRAREGTRFHEWLERRGGPRRGLFETDELLGAADDAAGDAGLAELRARFERSEWADAELVGVEVPFSTTLVVHGRPVVLRGRVDAVVRPLNRSTGGGRARTGAVRADVDLEVVDWKTGSPPSGAAAAARAHQLAVYRLATARAHGLPPERVGAAFWYAGSGPAGTTVRPRDLLDEAGLVRLLENSTGPGAGRER